MDNAESNAWVFDSLVGFLHGPVWNIPIQMFIEEKSLPFEPTDDGAVLDRPEYKKIHVEYRNLVDVMLSSFMDDIGITVDQFEAACRLSAQDIAGLPAYFHKRLFEQIWAANDYEMFVKMMTHKNIELQLQALELIEKKFGTMPNLFSQHEDLKSSPSDGDSDWPDCDDVMTEIKKLQLQDIDVKDETLGVPAEKVVAEKQTLLAKLQHIDKTEETVHNEKEKVAIVQKEIPFVVKKAEVSDEEVRARQAYLKQQRDKLISLKKQVREKRLGAIQNENEAEGSKVPRPKSARVAQAALAGHALPPPSDALQLRRALASKLKREVVDINN